MQRRDVRHPAAAKTSHEKSRNKDGRAGAEELKGVYGLGSQGKSKRLGAIGGCVLAAGAVKVDMQAGEGARIYSGA